MNTLRVDLLKETKTSDTFVETGTARGEGIIAAMAAGFDKMWSIECNPDVYVAATERFLADDRVTLLLGDSGQVLPLVLEKLDAPAVFWLDAHWSTGEPEVKGADKCPLLRELAAIAQHPIKTHTILIDDMRYFQNGLEQWHGIKKAEIEQALKEINPDYRFDYYVGVVPNDILVARVPETPQQ